MLVNFDPIQNDEDATEELFNSRFNAILDAINGNIESPNIADGAVTTPKIADNAVTAAKIPNQGLTSAELGMVYSTHVFNSTVTSIPNGAVTYVNFDSERFDTDGMHSISADTGRITFVNTGIYAIGANIGLVAGTGRRIVDIMLNGTKELVRIDMTPSGGEFTVSPTTVYSFTAGDYIQVRIYQASGGALNTFASTASGTAQWGMEFWAYYIGTTGA